MNLDSIWKKFFFIIPTSLFNLYLTQPSLKISIKNSIYQSIHLLFEFNTRFGGQIWIIFKIKYYIKDHLSTIIYYHYWTENISNTPTFHLSFTSQAIGSV